ncbi:hypothetical protein DVH24_040156 [Malus domestica]|uniref:Uncharacterized protein n=1 Tax=Malus domestica TaxID=3750 RepID=A0A498IMM8_MALDO|nr:hypothetical protein DVH24_040156 [Malus domestica]
MLQVLEKYTTFYDITLNVKKKKNELKKKLDRLKARRMKLRLSINLKWKMKKSYESQMLEKLHMLTTDQKSLEDELIEMKKKFEELSIG